MSHTTPIQHLGKTWVFVHDSDPRGSKVGFKSDKAPWSDLIEFDYDQLLACALGTTPFETGASILPKEVMEEFVGRIMIKEAIAELEQLSGVAMLNKIRSGKRIVEAWELVRKAYETPGPACP